MQTLNDVVKDAAPGLGVGLMPESDSLARVGRDSQRLSSQKGFIFGSDIMLEDGMEDEFDWEMAVSELEQESNLLLKNLLRTHNGPVCNLSDEKGMTLLHHAVLKGTPGKTRFILEFSQT